MENVFTRLLPYNARYLAAAGPQCPSSPDPHLLGTELKLTLKHKGHHFLHGAHLVRGQALVPSCVVHLQVARGGGAGTQVRTRVSWAQMGGWTETDLAGKGCRVDGGQRNGSPESREGP